MFLKTVKGVKLEVRPLFLPQLVRLTAMLKPGLTTINVSSAKSIVLYIFKMFALTVFECKPAIKT